MKNPAWTQSSAEPKRRFGLVAVMLVAGVLTGGCFHDGANMVWPHARLSRNATCAERTQALADQFERLVDQIGPLTLSTSTLRIVAGLRPLFSGQPDPAECPTMAADAASAVPIDSAKQYFRSISDDRDLRRAIDKDPVFANGTALEALFDQVIRDSR